MKISSVKENSKFIKKHSYKICLSVLLTPHIFAYASQLYGKTNNLSRHRILVHICGTSYYDFAKRAIKTKRETFLQNIFFRYVIFKKFLFYFILLSIRILLPSRLHKHKIKTGEKSFDAASTRNNVQYACWALHNILWRYCFEDSLSLLWKNAIVEMRAIDLVPRRTTNLHFRREALLLDIILF